MDAQPATRVTTTMGSTWCIVFYDEPPVSASQTVCCTSKLAGPYAEGGDTCVGMMLPASSPAYAARQAQLATFASRPSAAVATHAFLLSVAPEWVSVKMMP